MGTSVECARTGRVLVCLLVAASLIFVTACGSSPSVTPQPVRPPVTIPGANTITTPNPSGQLQSFSSSGSIDTKGAFFQNLGTNGRTCNSCHQADQGWTISAAQIQTRFDSSSGTDPLFRPVDGTNCPTDDLSTVAARTAATTLIRTRGLIRIARSIPAGAEFTLSAVSDPHSCSVGGLSLYRRPLPSTNVKFLSSVMFDGRESTPGQTLVQNLKTQARNATIIHAEGQSPTEAQLTQIVEFQLALFTAQISDVAAGSLTAERATGGPIFLASQPFSLGMNEFGGGGAFTPQVFELFSPWADLSASDPLTPARAAIARGQVLFNTRNMFIAGVNGLNDVTGQAQITGTCSTCHESPNLGHRSQNRLMDIGTTDAGRRTPDMPLYTLSCPGGVNRQTMDPGLAMTTGLCADIGKLKVPLLRGLAARAPYFHDGQAATLAQVLDFYRLRFGLVLGPQEQADLIAFLNSL